jgi:hypothetical protein
MMPTIKVFLTKISINFRFVEADAVYKWKISYS